jgi:hypothetical protein
MTVVIQHRHPSLILPVVRIQIATSATVSDSLFHRLVLVMGKTVNQLANDHLQDIRICFFIFASDCKSPCQPECPENFAEEHNTV